MEKPIEEMNKNELAEHALSEFAVDLDMTKKVSELRAEVSALVKDGVPAKEDPVQDRTDAAYLKKPGWLKNPATGFVFPATPLIRKLTNLVECDANGKEI